VFSSVGDLLKEAPDFVITAVPWHQNLPLIEELSNRGIAVLSETPVAPGLEDLRRVYALSSQGARIQVAEQYLFQPMHAARLRLISDGRLGNISQADVSVSHGYHGISMIRNFLQTGLALPRITARSFASTIVAGPGREGPPYEHKTVASSRTIAQLDYGDRLGIYDFSGDQYFSWIRSQHLRVRGEAGEINQREVRILQDFRTCLQFDLVRRDTGHNGNLEGYYHEAVLGGGEVLYRNPFPGPRWSDDEIAVATCLAKMGLFAAGGEQFYTVAEAAQDRYLDILIEEAVRTGTTVEAQPQPWS
jgi:predicted dehydrogenase